MIGIVQNAFYRGFDEQCRALKTELEKRGEEAEIFDNLTLWRTPDDGITFTKCIFMDKDIPLGLRLERLGIRLYNDIGAIELCDDKRRTQVFLETELKTPRTVIFPLAFRSSDFDLGGFARHVSDTLGFPLVAKEAYGSLGEQVTLICDKKSLEDYMTAHIAVPHLYQKFIAESAGRDLRVYVVGGIAQAAIERKNDSDFRANLALGGSAKAVTLSEEAKKAAEEAARLLGLDFCGVDLLYADDGEPYICEVNSNALFAGISRATGVNIAALIARHVASDKRIAEFF